jgi:hypothetical protein
MDFDKENGIGEVSFHYASYGTHSGGIIVLYYSTDGGVTWIEAGDVTAPAWSGAMELASFVLNIQGSARIKIVREREYANGRTVNIDDLTITDFSPAGYVASPIFNPPSGSYLEPINVAITSATEGATIRYTLDGSDPNTESALYSTSILVSTPTTIKAKAWKEGMEASAISTANYTFPQGISTLAELRALAPGFGQPAGTTVYKYTGNAVITQMQNFNNVKYIQDETAAIMIFDPPTGSGKITGVQIGDQITNISGTLTNYFGMLQILPVENCTPVGWDKKVPATLITLSQLDYEHDNPIQAKLVRVEQVSFTETGVFEATSADADRYYSLIQNSVTYDSVMFIEKREADFIGTPIPTTLVNIHAVVNFKGHASFPTRNRIVMLDNANNVYQVSIANFNKSAIKLAPNPATHFVNVITGSTMKMEVYSLLGNLIATETLSEGSNIVSVSNYPAGMYIMKLTDTKTGQAFTQKLVIK